MRYEHAELHNVHELLSGALSELLDGRPQTLSGCAPRRAGATDEGAGLVSCRIPDSLRRTLNQGARTNALAATGCEIRFNLRGPEARITLRSTDAPALAEVYQGSFLTSWQVVDTTPTAINIALPANLALLKKATEERSLPFDPGLTRVVLPWRPICRLLELQGEFEPPRPGQTPKVRCLSYGSSITHGNLATRPRGCWAARTAERLGVDLLNLGFGGGAHLEPQLADHIASRDDWQIATLEMGINLIGSIDAEEFRRRVDYYVRTIAGGHPDRWVFAIDLFTCAWDLRRDEKINQFRRAVREAVGGSALPRLVHVPGDKLLTSIDGLSADLTHPSPAGMEEIAERLARRMREAMRGG